MGKTSYRELAHDEKYIKTKVISFHSEIHTIFWDDEISKKGIYYTCIVAITIDSIMKIDKKYFPQVYLEECRYDVKKKKVRNFIDTELVLTDFDCE